MGLPQLLLDGVLRTGPECTVDDVNNLNRARPKLIRIVSRDEEDMKLKTDRDFFRCCGRSAKIRKKKERINNEEARKWQVIQRHSSPYLTASLPHSLLSRCPPLRLADAQFVNRYQELQSNQNYPNPATIATGVSTVSISSLESGSLDLVAWILPGSYQNHPSNARLSRSQPLLFLPSSKYMQLASLTSIWQAKRCIL